jgi:hypothetical protein
MIHCGLSDLHRLSHGASVFTANQLPFAMSTTILMSAQVKILRGLVTIYPKAALIAWQYIVPKVSR